ncbi:MAG: hypothetical protein ACKORA_08100 [Solirubrobacterales bacterium]
MTERRRVVRVPASSANLGPGYDCMAVALDLHLELWHYVQEVNRLGTSILLTTHYLEEAEQLCDQIAFINHGEIVAQGTSPELAGRFGVNTLEDAYLELVGRKELSRSHLGELDGAEVE